MQPAARIEPHPASRTTIPARHVLRDAQLSPTDPAKHRRLPPLVPRPDLNRMPRQSLVAILAGVIHPATLHLDCDHIQRASPVHTPRLRIQPNPSNPQAQIPLNRLRRSNPTPDKPQTKPKIFHDAFSPQPTPISTKEAGVPQILRLTDSALPTPASSASTSATEAHSTPTKSVATHRLSLRSPD
jgi:hypothetical protein